MSLDQYLITVLFAGIAVQYLHTMSKIHKEIKKIADSKCSDEYRKQQDQREAKAKKRVSE